MTKAKRRYRTHPASLPPTSTNAKTHQKARQKMRRKLRDKGYSEEEIADVIERMHFEQDCARLGVEAASQLRYDRLETPDDKGYKPSYRDPLLHGVARATGETAKAVRNPGKAIVK